MEATDPSLQEAPGPPASEVLAPATTDDLSDIKRVMQQASDFKRDQGDDLWGPEPFTDDEVTKMIESGDMFVYRVDGVVAASIILAKSDKRMWGDEQGGDETALYIHKFCIGNDFRGQGRKVALLAENLAREYDKTRLRLDCPYDNRPLCEYYESLGFHEVRRYDRPNSEGGRSPDTDVYKAALYEKELASSGTI